MQTVLRVSLMVAGTWFWSLSTLDAAWAQGTPGFPTVAPAEQVARDGDSLRILREELDRESRLVEDQTKRKAERLVVGDARGVQESEDALQRHTRDVQSLRQEIDLAERRASSGGSTPASPVSVSATRRATSKASTATPVTAWWDVYGRAPERAQPLASQSSSERGARVDGVPTLPVH